MAISSVRDRLVFSLNEMSAKTERVFLELGRSFPRLLSEMDLGLAESAAFIAALDSSFREGRDNQSKTACIMADTAEEFDRAAERYASLHARSEQILGEIEDRTAKLSGLGRFISAIHEDSEAMELISLNAMVLGVKAGASGRAFSYITEELRRLSSKTIGLSEATIRMGESLQQRFADFRAGMTQAREMETRLFIGFKSRLQRSFDDIRLGMRQLAQMMTAIVARSTDARDPLLRIMEGVQLQDIIRQSIDHVILSLGELKDIESLGDDDCLGDEIAFARALPPLCASLLDDIKGRISGALGSLREGIDSVRGIISQLERERESFARSVSDGNGGSLAALFDESNRILEELLTDLSACLRIKGRIAQESVRLLEDVARLEGSFKSFEVIVNRFKSIDIASRIEVAKQSVLKLSSGTVDEMSDLTNRIDSDVAAALEATREFIRETDKTLSSYSDILAVEDRFSRGFEGSIRSGYESLTAARTEATARIHGFSLYTGRFFRLFTDTERQLDEVAGLVKAIHGVQRDLDLLDEATRSTSITVSEASAEIVDQRLRRIIDRFTIFGDKEKVGAAT